MIKLTLEFTTAAEAIQALANLESAMEVTKESPAQTELSGETADNLTEGESSRKPQRQTRETKASPKPKEVGQPTKDEVRKYLSEVGKEKSLEDVQRICNRADCTGLKDMNPEKYAEVIAACKEVLNNG